MVIYGMIDYTVFLCVVVHRKMKTLSIVERVIFCTLFLLGYIGFVSRYR